MADDTQFDAFAGLPTPQTLALQRAMNQQALYAQSAQTAGSGRDFGARNAGITLGGQLGAGGSGNILDRMAQQNQQILSQPPPGTSANGPANPASVAAASGQDAAAPADPYEARAQDFEQKAKAFNAAGNYSAANQFMAAAQIARKQGLDAQKSQAETFKDIGQGNEAMGKTWSTPQAGVNPTTGKDEYFQTGPGGAVRWTGAPARPQTPAAQVTINQEKPFLTNFASTLDKYKQAADTSVQGLSMLQDARAKLEDGAYTGTTANVKLQFGTMLSSLGFKSSDNAVANTQAFLAETKSLALASKPSGMSRITDADIRYLTSISGGDIALTKPAIEKIFDIRQMAMEGNIKAYNNAADTLSTTASSQKDPATKQGLAMATSLYPKVAIPDSSNVPVMTPQQVMAARTAGKSGTKYRTTDGRPGVVP